ncbi:winged helix-turn-helix transcriptional regulator [Candidatus Saccharibacteria bacterium]|nr:winged helix-turn-helix transcriptional regulator [Candidatus Saccharibacteria bacterium]
MSKTTSATNISPSEERMIYAMQLLGDKTRYKMFKLLSGSKELCVGEIADQVGTSISAVSQHFRNFEMLGLVNKERMGQKICYGLNSNDKVVKQLSKLIK